MKMNLRDILPRPRLAAAGPVLAGCLLLAACGSSTHSASPAQSTSTKTSTTGSSSTTASAPPASGSTLVAGLIKQMATSQPQLKHVKAQCPGGTITRYPVKCHFTATQTASGKTVKFAGTISVSGKSGTSYEYGLNYAPTH